MSASESQRLKELYEFGPFRVDPEKEILLRAGEPVPLTPKPFQILLVLVRHHKEVVTEDDLMKEVWPDTFVEEANLSRNIFMLRKALGESPQDHQYILTVPGRGYRLAESVRLVPEEEVSIVAAQHSNVQIHVKESKPWGWIALGAIVVVAVAVGAVRFFMHRTPVLTEKDTVVLADFANSTGNPVFDGTLQQGLSIQLEQSPFLTIVPDQQIQQTLRMMGQKPNAKLTPEIARELCQRTASTLYAHLAVLYKMLGDLEKSLDNACESVRLEPTRVNNNEEVIAAYTNLDRLNEAEVALKQTEQRNVESEGLLWLRYRLDFLEGDAARAAQTVSEAMGKPGAENWLLEAQSDTEAWHGRFHSARALTRRAMDSAERNDAKELSATYQAETALLEAEVGNREQARADASAAVKLGVNQNVLATAALAVARAGDIAMAEKLGAELDRTYPLNTLIQRYRLPTIRAAIALQRKDPNQAIQLLQETSPIELGDEGHLLPVYLRGQAYLMLEDGNRAAQEFEKFAAHRGLVGNFPLGALAGLDLGRAYALAGDKDKAQTAYRDFLNLWKNADTDVPILEQAKAEYASLK